MSARAHFLVLLTLFLGVLAALAEPPPSDPRWEQAQKAYGEGFPDEGHRLLKAIIAEHPGDFDLAAACYEKIFAQEYPLLPKHVPFNNLGQPMHGQWHATNHITGVNGNMEIPPTAERILALERLGALSAHTAFLRTVGGACLEGGISRRAYLELGQMLTRLRSENPRDPFWLIMEAHALSSMQRPEAVPLLNELRRRIDLDHPDAGLRSDWMVADAFLSQGLDLAGMARPAVPEGSPLPALAPVNPDDPEDPWRKVLDRSPKDVPGEVDRLIALATSHRDLLMWVNTDGGGLHPTRALDLHLLSKPSAELEALRKLQETLVSPEAQAAARTEADILKLTRRYPWARSGQVLLLKIANEALWTARFESAWRSFQDVLLHTSDPALREAAQVGIWTAQALSGGEAEVLAQPTAFEPAKTYPWMGRPTKGAEIRAALQAMVPPVPTVAAPALKDLRPHVVHLPPVSPWVINAHSGVDYSIDLQVSGKTLLATGRNLIAAYDAAKPGAPLWTHAQPFPSEKNNRASFPGYYRGLIEDGTIITRWGATEQPNGLAALNLATGDPLWTSLNAVANGFSGENLKHAHPIPLGDPVRADGKLFYLQTTVTSGRADGRPVFSLVCFDPAIAQPVWAAPIIDSKADVGNLQHQYSFTYGNAVTVHRGAVYSCSNVGHIARSDVRDGRVEWAHKYEYRGGDNGGCVGSTPIIAGSNVIFLPRNTERLIALDQRTGAVAWDNLGIRAFEVLGLWQDTLVVRGPKHLAGLDVATGNTRWIRNLTQRSLTRGQLIADSVYFGESGTLQRLDARTGESLESRPWAIESERALSFNISGQDLYIATDQPRDDPRQKVGQPLGPEVASSAQPLKLPLKPAWSLMRPGASLILPPAGVNAGTAILLGDGMIECLEVNERGRIRWRRVLDLKTNQLVVRFIGKNAEILVLLEQGESFDNPPRAIGMDTKTGATLWQTTVPLWRDPAPTLVGSRLIFGSHSRRGGGSTAIDLTTGKQLWRRYLRSTAPPVAKGDESRLMLLGSLWTAKPTRVSLNAQTGQTIADSTDKSALPTMFFTVHSRNGPSVYHLPPVGDATVFQPQAGIVDQVPGTGAPYYLIHPRDGNDKTPMGVYRADDPTYFCKITNDNILFDGDYAITVQGKLEITDLKAKRLLPLPAADEKAPINQPGLLCRVGPDRLLKLVDHGSAKNVVFTIDLANGTVTEGKLELPSQDGPITLANYTNVTPLNRPFLPNFDRVFLTYDNTTVTAWVADL